MVHFIDSCIAEMRFGDPGEEKRALGDIYISGCAACREMFKYLC
jgi:hypothetical protein